MEQHRGREGPTPRTHVYSYNNGTSLHRIRNGNIHYLLKPRMYRSSAYSSAKPLRRASWGNSASSARNFFASPHPAFPRERKTVLSTSTSAAVPQKVRHAFLRWRIRRRE